MKIIKILDGKEVYQKCPDCGSIEFSDEITCAKCGYQYWIFDSEPVNPCNT